MKVRDLQLYLRYSLSKDILLSFFRSNLLGLFLIFVVLNVIDYYNYFERENEIAHFYDVLSETEDTISYAEHIDPKKKFSICGMDYEEYVDVKKKYLKGLTYDQILNYLRKFKKEERLEKYKILLKFRNIPFDADLFTWNSD